MHTLQDDTSQCNTLQNVALYNLKVRIQSHTMAEACLMSQRITAHHTSLAWQLRVEEYRRHLLSTAVIECMRSELAFRFHLTGLMARPLLTLKLNL